MTTGVSETLLLLAPIGLPLLAAAGFAVGGWRRLTAAFGVVAIAAMLAGAGLLANEVNHTGPLSTMDGYVRADALTAWMLLVVAAVSLLALGASPAYLAGAGALQPRRARGYGVLFSLFVAAMATAVLSGNLGVLWVAIEATTIVTAFLVGHHGTRTALEAAWKYVLICSAAIAIAFLGLVLLYYAARRAGLDSASALDWAALTANAGHLDPAVTRLAIALLVLGFGAKAGLIPLHAWLPDAHSQAPAPVSALMSGVLLAVAFSAVLRFKAVADAALGPAFLRTLLLIMALGTVAMAAVLLVGQRDVKRMLAYSSMEHLGLIAFGAAIGTRLALAAVLLHMAAHGLAKAVAFLSSGHILHRCGSSAVASVRGLAADAPGLAAMFALAIAALLGFPPAALFASELGIARAGADARLGWAVALVFALALLAFAAITAGTGRMLLGPPGATPSAVAAPTPSASTPSASTPDGSAAAASAGDAVAAVSTPDASAAAVLAAPVATLTRPVPVPVPSGTVTGGSAPPPAPAALSPAMVGLLLLGLLAVAALGISTGPLTGLLHDAAAIIGAP